MAAALPASNLANLLSLPARYFAVVDAGSQRTHILLATIARGRPRLARTFTIDAFEEGFTSDEEMREQVRQRLRQAAPEAVILLLPQHRLLRHVLDVPPTDATQTRAIVEREASNIGGLSESQWAFDSVRLRPFARLANPLAAAFCRQDHLQELIEAWCEDERAVFDIRPSGDALAAAFRHAAPQQRNAVVVDLGARHTSVGVLLDGQTVFATSFPSGSEAFTQALATDQGISPAAAEALKRSGPPDPAAGSTGSAAPQFLQAIQAWLSELEHTLQEWREDHPDIAGPAGTWTVFLAGGGARQPGLLDTLRRLGPRPFEPWPATVGADKLPPDAAPAWGGLLLALGLVGPAPSLLPPERRSYWSQQRLWRALLSVNLVLAGLLVVLLGVATWHQTRLLAGKAAWKQDAVQALEYARDIRRVSEAFNQRMDSLRPVLEAQRQTVETLQVLAAIQQQRTNAQHWYVLLGDASSYTAGSNNFAPPPPPRPAELRFGGGNTASTTNLPPPGRAFIAEVCLIPQGERMRQALSELVSELKRYPLFRNVDVLPPERRRDLVATNLVFAERHFALELNLSETELLPALQLPSLNVTNREPRTTFRSPIRPPENAAANGTTNKAGPRPPRAR